MGSRTEPHGYSLPRSRKISSRHLAIDYFIPGEIRRVIRRWPARTRVSCVKQDLHLNPVRITQNADPARTVQSTL